MPQIKNRKTRRLSKGFNSSETSTPNLSGLKTEVDTLQDGVVVDANKNTQVGDTDLLTTATDGFLYIPQIAGTPSGVPTIKTGYSPLAFDEANDKLWIYNGTAWKSTTLA